MNEIKIIKIGNQVALPTIFENSVVEYWNNQRGGKINQQLLEKIKLIKQLKIKK